MRFYVLFTVSYCLSCGAVEVSVEFVSGLPGKASVLVSELTSAEVSPLGGKIVCSWLSSKAGIDGEHFFPVEEKHDLQHETVSYLPKARGKFELTPGEHTVTPGGLRFSIDRSKVTRVEKPIRLLEGGGGLSVPCFPVEFKVVDQTTERRDLFNIQLFSEGVAFPALSGLLGLTEWLPANGSGRNYVAVVGNGSDSVRFSFHLSRQGIRISGDEGRVSAEGHRIKISLRSPVRRKSLSEFPVVLLNPPASGEEAEEVKSAFGIRIDPPVVIGGQDLTVRIKALRELEREPSFKWLGWWGELERIFPTVVSRKGGALIYAVQPPRGFGVYRLRIELAEKGMMEPWSFETVVAVAPEGRGGLSIFTDRNRRVFLEGETIEFSLLARGEIEERVGKFVLYDWRGQKIKLPLEFSLSDELPETLSFRLDTSLLAPGWYELEARVGNAPCIPFRFLLVPLTRKTHFDIIEWHQYGGRGSLFHRGFGERLGEMGYNFVGGNLCGMDFNLPFTREEERWAQRLRRWNEVVGQLARTTPTLPAEESLYFPSMIDRGLEDYLKHRIGLVAVVFGGGRGMVLNFAIPEDENERRRIISLWSLGLRRYPGVMGLAYCCGDGAMPPGWDIGYVGLAAIDLRREKRMRILREGFERKYGPLGEITEPLLLRAEETDIHNALGLLYTRLLKRKKPPEEIRVLTQKAERRIQWCKWLNSVWMKTFLDMRTLSAQFDPRFRITCGSTFGSLARAGVWFPLWYRNQDIRVNSRCTDYGVYVNHYLGYTDFMRVGMRETDSLWVPVRHWVGRLEAYPTVAFRDQVSALSRGITGGGIWENGFRRGRNTSAVGAHLALQNNAFMERYGDLFLSLERRDDIALLHSFTESAVLGDTYERVHLAHFALTRLGYMVRIVDEEDLAEGKLGGARVLFLVRQHIELPPRARTALESFQRSGGVVVADNETTLRLEGLIRIPVSFPVLKFRVDGKNEFDAYYKFTLKNAEVLRGALRALVQPVAELPARHSLKFAFGRLGFGESTYIFAMNYTSPEAETTSQCEVLPVLTTLKLSSNYPVVYDLLSGRKLSARRTGEWVEIPGDFRSTPARIYALLPEELGSIELETLAEAKGGKVIALRCTVFGRSGRELRVALPIEVRVTAPDGALRYHLFRSVRGHLDENLKLALNDPPGDYRIQLQELITGLTAETTLRLRPVPVTLPPQALSELGDVITVDPKGIRESLLSGQPYTILLDPVQRYILRDAQRLMSFLRKSGVTASVRIYDELEFRNYPMQWHYKLEDLVRKEEVLSGKVIGYRVRGKNHLGDYRFDGINYNFYTNYSPQPPWAVNYGLILIGKPGENHLLDSLLKENIFTRKLTPNFPGRGKGLIQLVRSPFLFGNHAICVMANDTAGLRKALRKLELFQHNSFVFSPHVRRPRLMPGRLHLLKRPEIDGLSPAAGSRRTVRSQERSDFPRFEERFGTWIESFDARKGRIVVGLRSWGDNLVVTDTEGNPLWAQKTSKGNSAGRGVLLNNGCVSVEDEHTTLLDPRGDPLLRTPYTSCALFLPDGSCFYSAPADSKAVYGEMGYNFLLAFDGNGKFLWSYDTRQLYANADDHIRKRSVRKILPLPGNRLAVLFSIGEPFFKDPPQKDFLLILDRRNGNLIRKFDHASIKDFVTSPTGRFIALCHRPARRQTTPPLVEVFDLDGRLFLRSRVPGKVAKLAIDNSGGSVFVKLAGLHRGLYLLRAGKDGAVELKWIPAENRLLTDFAITSDGSTIFTGTLNGELLRIDSAGRVVWRRQIGQVCTVLKLLGGNQIALSTSSGRLIFYELNGKEIRTIDLSRHTALSLKEIQEKLEAIGQVPVLAPPPDLWRKASFLDSIPKPVEISENLLAAQDRLLVITPEKPQALRIPRTAPGSTYVLLFQYQNDPDSELSLELLGSHLRGSNWLQVLRFSRKKREGVYAFKGSSGRLLIRFSSTGTRTVVSELKLHHLRFPTENFAYIPSPMKAAEAITELKPGFTPQTSENTVDVRVTGIYAADMREKTLPPTANYLKLFNGVPYDMGVWYRWVRGGKSWYQLEYFSEKRGYPVPCYLTLTLSKQRTIGIVAVWEDNTRPEFITRESVLEYWDEGNGRWVKLTSADSNQLPYHIHTFRAVCARKFRYTIILPGSFEKDSKGRTAPLFHGTEIELYGTEPQDIEELNTGEELLP